MDTENFLEHLIKEQNLTYKELLQIVSQGLISQGHFSEESFDQYAKSFQKDQITVSSQEGHQHKILKELEKYSEETEKAPTKEASTQTSQEIRQTDPIFNSELLKFKSSVQQLLEKAPQKSTNEIEANRRKGKLIETTFPSSQQKVIPPLLFANQKLNPNATQTKIPTEPGNISSLQETRKISQNEEGRYILLDSLGEGGMGIVHKVRDKVLNREVALKRLKFGERRHGSPSLKTQMMEWRLKTEAEITAFLEHPNIVPLYDLKKKNQDELYFTMRKIEGQTLNQILKSKRLEQDKIEPVELLSIFSKVCDAIAYAHSKEVIHRDLKPSNIMVGQFGEVYVMDWGIAKNLNQEIEKSLEPWKRESFSLSGVHEWQTVGSIGTPGYMPPEQRLDSSKVTIRSDIYALGKMLRECFTCLSPQAELKHILKEFDSFKAAGKKPTRIEIEKRLEHVIPQDIRAIITKATEPNPDKRYATVQELALDLEQYRQNNLISARNYNLIEVFWKWMQRNWKEMVFFSVVFAFLLLFFFYTNWLKSKEEKRRWQMVENERQQRFTLAYQNAQQKRAKAKKLILDHNTEKEKKVELLLEALNEINTALSLSSKALKIEDEKFSIGQELLGICLETKDYKLAKYVAKDLQQLKSLTEVQKEALLKEVEKERTKTLRKHLIKLRKWEEKFLAGRLFPGEWQDALFEISKMPEKEIFFYLVEQVERGTDYFLANTKIDANRTDYYQAMVEALGRLENPEAIPIFLNSLQKMAEKYTTISTGERPIDAIQYMILLAKGLANSHPKDLSLALKHIQSHMGPGLFSTQTVMAYKKMILQDKIFTATPSDSRGYYLRGDSKREIGYLEEAIQDFNEAIKLAPDKRDPYFGRARAYADKGDNLKALQDYNHLIKICDDKFEVYLERGTLKKELELFEEAIKDHTLAIQLRPNSSTAYANRGLAKKKQGDFKGALEDYSKAIQLNPNLEHPYLNRGVLKHDLKEFEAAIEDYNTVIQLNPQNENAYNNRAITKATKGDIIGAIEDFTYAIQLNPQDGKLYLNRGNMKMKRDHFPGAVEDYSKALRLNPSSVEYYYYRGNARQANKQFQQAILDYNILLQHMPKHARGFFRRGTAKAKNRENPLSDFNKAIQLNPRYREAYHERSLYWYEQKNLQKSIEDLDQIIKIDPKDVEAYMLRGQIWYELNKLAKAIQDFSQAIQYAPELTNAYYLRGNAYYLLKNYPPAIEDYNQVILQDRSHYEAYRLRGELKHFQGQYQAAILDFQQAAQLKPTEAFPHFLQANSYKKLGELEKTIKAFERGIKRDPYRPKVNEYAKIVWDRMTKSYRNKEIEKAYQDALRLKHHLPKYHPLSKKLDAVLKTLKSEKKR